MNKYAKRLYEEWKKHGKIILAVDYDSTLAPWPTIDNQEDIERVIKIVKRAQQTGCYTVLFTASEESRYDLLIEYCKNLGIVLDAINTNPITLPYGHSGKIYYNHHLCDRSGLNEALNILEEATGLLTTVFKNGELVKRTTLEEIRSKLKLS